MSQETIIPNTEVSFKDFLFKNKRNRTILWLAAAAIVIQFAVFKYFYPFADYIHGDSFSYIRSASENLSINTYLIGYSKFLRLFSVFAISDLALVAFQYVFIQISVLFLLFTLSYLYNPSRIVQTIIICVMVFNPLFLHLGNLVSSDGFFLGISTIWFTLLLWIIHKPSSKIIIWHSIVLITAFTVRYNAMIYPLISFVAFLLSKRPLRNKISGFGIGVLLCGLFIAFTSYNYKKLTGTWQYSPFSGWQIANNAMYAYRYVDRSERKEVPKKFYNLDKMIRDWFDSTRDIKKFPTEGIMASTYYMWSGRMPLMKYKEKMFKNDTSSSELKKWASMAPFYKEYGIYIIKSYPIHFGKYFVWPNANKYYAPPLEFLEVYNSGKEKVTKEAKTWFNYKSTKVYTRFSNNDVWILNFYPIASGIINIVMLCGLVFYLNLKGWRYNKSFSKGIIIGSIFWLSNAGFTIFASSAALRFQSFPIVIVSIYNILLLDWMIQLLITIRNNTSTTTEENINNHYIQKNILPHS